MVVYFHLSGDAVGKAFYLNESGILEFFLPVAS